MLYPLAQISLPADTARKLSRADELSADEQAMIDRLPALTDQLLAHIPRLETVRVMLAKAQEPYRQCQCFHPIDETQIVNLGAKFIKAAVAFDALVHGGRSPQDAVRIQRGVPERFDLEVVNALGELYAEADDPIRILEVATHSLTPGMVLADDLSTSGGMLLVTRGYEVTPAFIERLRNYRPGAVKAKLRILVGRNP